MKKLLIPIILILGLILLSGCKTEIEFKELKPEKRADLPNIPSCHYIPSYLDGEKGLGGKFVIRTQEEYQDFLKSLYNIKYQNFLDNIRRYPKKDIPEYSYNEFFNLCNAFPEIDFNKYTLLGKFTVGGGCSVDFIKHVYRDDSNKRIIYSIKVVEKGICEMAKIDMNWVLIQKIPDNYEVVFKVKKK